MKDATPGEGGTVGGERRWRGSLGWSLLMLLVAVGMLLGIYPAQAALQRGTANNDVIWGADNDNAANAFIQPTAVAAKQHMENTDVLQGGGNGDLLIGRKGDDVIDGQSGDDILIGGVENFVAPNSDVLLGGTENDINIWAPGDGSDMFVGDSGYDVQVFAPFELQDGQPALFYSTQFARHVPRVSIDNKPQFRCRIDAVPAGQNMGVRFVTRFFASDKLAVTVRQQDVELVLCPSPNAGMVLAANLQSSNPTLFVEQPLSTYSNTLLGAILQAP